MIFEQIITINFSIISTIIIGAINLITPFLSKQNSGIRNLTMLIVSLVFLLNILIIDWLFLNGAKINLQLFTFQQYSFDLHLEVIGIIFLNLISVLWICAIIYTNQYLSINNIEHSDRFLFFFNLVIIVGVFLALSANLFSMFICYELLTLATLPLITYGSSNKIRYEIYHYFKILMCSSILLFMPAILFVYSKMSHGNFIYNGFIENNFSYRETIILLLMFIFGISKSAPYPLHGWLTSAMVAPYPASALLHAVVIVKAGLFCIIKIILYIFGVQYLHSLFVDFNWLILLPAITILYSGFHALKTSNIKTILAYSTINQLAIVLLSVFMFTQKSIAAAILQMISHAIAKISLFYAAGNYYSVRHTTNIKHLFSFGSIMPRTSLMFLIAALSLIGIPPLGGFFSKFYILLAAAEQQQFIVMTIILISTILSALYMIRILIFIYKTDKLSIIHAEKFLPEEKLPISMLLSPAICILGVILFFFLHKLINKFLLYI